MLQKHDMLEKTEEQPSARMPEAVKKYYRHNRNSNSCSWEMLSLEDTLAFVEEGMLPRPSVENLVYITHECTERNLASALRLHAFTQKSGLEAHESLGNYIVSMLVEVKSMHNAQKVFDRLVSRNEYSWSSLINGYIECGESTHALIMYQKMQEDSLHLSGYTFVALLKACAKLKDVERGGEIHSQIARKGLLKRDVFVGSTLVDMYAKCGSLAKAQEVFYELPVRTVVSWNALIAGYAKHEHGEEALNCFEQMQLEGVSPNAITFACSLKACGSVGAIGKGREIHAEIDRRGLLRRDVVVGSALVNMYAKCGLLAKAQEVFEKLPVRNVGSWNALIAGYAKQECAEEALKCFKQMQLEGVSPNAITFTCSLKACGSAGAIDKGIEIHDEIVRKGLLKRDLVLGSALVDMYAKCGLLAKAREVFDKLPVQNLGSWNALIAGYAKHDSGEEALNCLKQMQLKGVSPDSITFSCSLKACGSIGDTDKGREIHAEIERKGLLEKDPVVGSALVDMYAKFGLLTKAQEVFDKLPVRSIGSWTALISGYAKQEHGEKALNCFEQMQLEGVSPDAITLTCSLKACGSTGATDKGREIHADIKRIGLERDVVVGNALVDMYAKCGLLALAEEVFEKLLVRNVLSWTALIAGYAEHGHGEKALKCFERMQLDGVSPDVIAFACSLKACGSIGAAGKGREIHSEIERKGLLDGDLVVGSALFSMYIKCGLLAKAQEVFDELPNRGVISWNALITGYLKHEHGEEALKCFEQMQLEGISPDAITFTCSLMACGSIGAIDKGRLIHAEIERKRLLKRDLVVGNALVDMYAKFGLLAKAQEVFDKLPSRDEVSWDALIAGYSQLGESENVFCIFDRMRREGNKPSLVTFVSVLNACSHTGLVDKAATYFDAMIKDFGITPTVEHHACMIDLFGRTGQLDRALAMMEKLPFHPDIVIWCTVLGACRKWGNVELGRQAFEHAMQLNEKEAGAYVCMYNIYVEADMQEDAKKVEEMRVKNLWK